MTTVAIRTPRPAKPVPTRSEVPFGIEELFFSSTDTKGVVTSGNDVFMRVSGYAGDELIGHAHNVVRHPDMPRAAFQIFWDYLSAGRPVAAYVKNMAADGSYYWVLAVAVPVDDGFLSIRLKPSSALFDAAREIYSDLHAFEKEIEGDDPQRRKEAIERSKERLLARLADAGFDSYDSFMHAAVPAEAIARENALPEGSAQARGAVLQAMLLESTGFGELKETLPQKSRFLRQLSEEIRLFSLNARLVGARLGDAGAVTSEIASLMRRSSDAVEPIIRELEQQIDAILEQLDDLGFRIAVANLQLEMAGTFERELATGDDAEQSKAADLGVLADTASAGVERLFGMSGLNALLGDLDERVRRLDRALKEFGVLELYGRVESTRLADRGQAAHVLFTTIGGHVDSATRELAELHRRTTAIRISENDARVLRAHAQRIVDVAAKA